MLTIDRTSIAGFAVATLLAAGSGAGIALARQDVPPPPDKLALGQDEVKQLLLLLDQDKNGKVSKQEFMQFMESEFNRLDKDHSGELDVKELTQSQVRASHFSAGGK